jgi:hypothetical protein
MCALCIMHFSNQHSLGAIFGREMTSGAAIAMRRRTVVDFVLSYLQMPAVKQQSRPARVPVRRLGNMASLVS